LIGWAGPLLAAIAAAAPAQNGGSRPAPALDAPGTIAPPATLALLRPARPTPAQRVVPGLH